MIACKFRNGGQTCVCTNRIYLHENIADEFVARLTPAVGALRVGDPLDTTTQIGPLVNVRGLAKMQPHISDALERGAHVLTGGRPLEGLYFEPTVLAGVNTSMRVMQEETFGPVAPVLRFGSQA